MCFIGRINLTLFKKLSGNGFRVGSGLFFSFLFTCALFTSPVRKVLQQTIPLTGKFFTSVTPLTHENTETFLTSCRYKQHLSTIQMHQTQIHKYAKVEQSVGIKNVYGGVSKT